MQLKTKKLTQASIVIVVLAGTVAVSVFANGLHVSELPRTVVVDAQAPLPT